MLTAPPGVPGYHLTEALSKRHPNGASVVSLRLFTINRNGFQVRRNTQSLGGKSHCTKRLAGLLHRPLGRCHSEGQELARMPVSECHGAVSVPAVEAGRAIWMEERLSMRSTAK